MKISEAARRWLEYHRAHSQKNTVLSYLAMVKRLLKFFGDRDLPTITTEDIQGFLIQYTAGCSNTTKKARFSFVNAFFNFVRDNLDHTVQNPCNTKALKRQFRPPVNRSWKVLEKDIVDEMIEVAPICWTAQRRS